MIEIRVLLMIASCYGSSTIQGPFPSGVPGSGYGFDKDCNGGDVNYVLRATLRTYPLLGTENDDRLVEGDHPRYSIFARTFEGVADESSPFCGPDGSGYDGTEGPLGPCLWVNPGQRMNIRLVNDLTDGMQRLNQHPVSLEEYFEKASRPNPVGLLGQTFHGEAPSGEGPDYGFKHVSHQNIPGNDASFDVVNLHLHGMQVVPHLFYPMGTGNVTAEWISIQPANEIPDSPERRVFCYVFDIPDDHPQGTFFYHTHRHGSVAMQGWQGMLGYLLVGDETSPGSPDCELGQQGIHRTEFLALWDWQVGENNTLAEQDEPFTFYETGFLLPKDVKVLWLANNGFQPTFEACVNETVHFRLLCGQTAYGSALYVVSDRNETDMIPFHAFASDGISYSRAYQRRAIVVGPGQRESLLFSFDEPGVYHVMQNVLFANNNFNTEIGFTQLAAIINVTTGDVAGNNCSEPTELVDLDSLTFTRGVQHNITPEEITGYTQVNFHVDRSRETAPVPQFTIDGSLFDYRSVAKTVRAGTSEQWQITSTTEFFHPYHIHLFPFSVQSVHGGDVPNVLRSGFSLSEALMSPYAMQEKIWRDTVFVPPYGVVTFNQRFGGASAVWPGKSVMHCHFLQHEDQGMQAVFLVTNPDSNDNEQGGGEDDDEQQSISQGNCRFRASRGTSRLVFALVLMLTFVGPF